MSSKKGTFSKTHRGDKNYTTKKGDKVFHRNHHYVKKSYRPYSTRQMIAGSRKRRTKRNRRSRKSRR
jgi:hypothetical protein